MMYCGFRVTCLYVCDLHPVTSDFRMRALLYTLQPRDNQRIANSFAGNLTGDLDSKQGLSHSLLQHNRGNLDLVMLGSSTGNCACWETVTEIENGELDDNKKQRKEEQKSSRMYRIDIIHGMWK